MSKIESKIIPTIGTVRNLFLVGGEANTAIQPGDVTPKSELHFNLDGVESVDGVLDRHHGATRVLRGYQAGKEHKGRIVANDRQVGVALARDLVSIAYTMNLAERIAERDEDIVSVMAKAMAVNVVLSDTDSSDSLTQHLGPGTNLYAADPEGDVIGPIMKITSNHPPCAKPGMVLANMFRLDTTSTIEQFKTAAARTRGYMASITSAGTIMVGDTIDAQLPVDFIGASRAFWTPES